MLDLIRQHARVKEAVSARVQAVFDSQQFILGRTVEEFEEAFCEYTGCPHAVGMSSGTDAQLAILMAMGIGAGDAVISTPYTFFATAGCIHRVGAEPVFVDIEPGTMHLDADKLADYLANVCRQGDDGLWRTPRGNVVRAVVPVHLFGVCVDMDRLTEVLEPYGLPIIEDAAQAIGSAYQWGTGETALAGNLGDSAYFSFFPTKNLGGAGDAGMAVCQTEELAHRLRLMRNHGMEQRYYHHEVGGNFRLDAIQAAVLHAKFPFIEEWNAGRRRNAELYREAFTSAGLLEEITLPAEPWKAKGLENHHTYHQYVARFQRRDELLKHLAAHGIGHAVYYPVSLHVQECFAYLGYKPEDCPESLRASQETVALPIYPELRDEEIAEIAGVITKFYRG